MIDVSLTDFMDFVFRTGPTQIATVKRIKGRPDYHPVRDYWKELRDLIVESYEKRLTLKETERRLGGLRFDRLHNFSLAFRGFKAFASKNEAEYFEPSKAQWASGDLAVRINPELCLGPGEPTTSIKLYFPESPRPTKQRVDAVLLMMAQAMPEQAVGLLDVRRGKLYRDFTRSREMEIYLRVQADAFVSMWQELP